MKKIGKKIVLGFVVRVLFVESIVFFELVVVGIPNARDATAAATIAGLRLLRRRRDIFGGIVRRRIGVLVGLRFGLDWVRRGCNGGACTLRCHAEKEG